MRLGLNVGYSDARMVLDLQSILEAERLGFHSVWAAEAYGSDAVSPAAWTAASTQRIKVGTAVMQMGARSPAMAAMTATTLDHLSGGRFLLGLGVSNPQVVEGWYGQPFGAPLTWTREYVEIVRAVWRREKPLEHTGDYYQMPYRGAKATGLGKPLKSILHGRPDLPIYLAAMGPKAVELAAEIGDGILLGVWYSPYRPELHRDSIRTGLGKRGGTGDPEQFDVVVTVRTALTQDIPAALVPVKRMLALYIGGMGARGKNFYHNLACRFGFEQDAKKVQDLYLEGKVAEAIAAVPDKLADDVALVGSKERLRDRLAAWREAGVTMLLLGTRQVDALRAVAELVL